LSLRLSAASIWFEVWGLMNPVAQILDSSRIKFRFSGKIFNFPGKKSDDLFKSSTQKIVFSPKILTFSPFAPAFLPNLSLFLIKKNQKDDSLT